MITDELKGKIATIVKGRLMSIETLAWNRQYDWSQREHIITEHLGYIIKDIIPILPNADAAYEKGKTESELKFNPDYLDFQKGVGVGRMMERVKISTDLISRADAGLDALPKVYSEFWKGYWQGRKEAGQSLKESK